MFSCGRMHIFIENAKCVFIYTRLHTYAKIFFQKDFAQTALFKNQIDSGLNPHCCVCVVKNWEKLQFSHPPFKTAILLLLSHFLCASLDILFSSNHNIHKSSCGLCFWASDPLIDRFY